MRLADEDAPRQPVSVARAKTMSAAIAPEEGLAPTSSETLWPPSRARREFVKCWAMGPTPRMAAKGMRVLHQGVEHGSEGMGGSDESTYRRGAKLGTMSVERQEGGRVGADELEELAGGAVQPERGGLGIPGGGGEDVHGLGEEGGVIMVVWVDLKEPLSARIPP